jgi:lactose/L-arabinose transport system permease protein
MAGETTRDGAATEDATNTVVSFVAERARAIGYNGLAIAGAILFAFPFYFMVVGSTLPADQIFQFPPRLIPGGQLVSNYTKALVETNFLRTLFNSLIYAVVSTFGVLVVATCAGYAFAKYTFPGHDALFYSTLVTLAIPFQLIAIPLFKLLVDFGLVDSFPGLILPALAHPVAVFFMKQNIEQTIIDDMLNSARIDGASETQIFIKIVLPLVRPGLAALAVLMFLLRMNGLFWPLIVMRSDKNEVATVFLAKLHGGPQAPTPWETMMPAALVATLPVLLVFIFLQKHFVEGLLAGTTKE